MTLFGLSMLFPALAARHDGAARFDRRPACRPGRTANIECTTAASSILLGVATGLVWAPCAGPMMGLILTGAALRGPGVETSLLLLTYGLGAATSLRPGMFFGRKLLPSPGVGAMGGWLSPRPRRGRCGGRRDIWLGADTGLLTRLSSSSTTCSNKV